MHACSTPTRAPSCTPCCRGTCPTASNKLWMRTTRPVETWRLTGFSWIGTTQPDPDPDRRLYSNLAWTDTSGLSHRVSGTIGKLFCALPQSRSGSTLPRSASRMGGRRQYPQSSIPGRGRGWCRHKSCTNMCYAPWTNRLANSILFLPYPCH